MVKFLGNIDVIVSSRLHLNILGACSCTPSIGLVRNSKIIDFARLINNPYVYLEDLSTDMLMNQIDLVINNKNKYADSIKESLELMKYVYKKSLQEVKEKIIE